MTHKKKLFFKLGAVALAACLAAFISCTDEVTSDNSLAMYEPYMVPKVLLQDAGIPIVSIETKNNQFILDKENWVDASIKIGNAEDESWNMEPTDMQIRGRGNTTWGCAKKPFAIKFDEKTKICGMPKHKRWVLIANYFDHSHLKNEMAFYLSRQLGLDYTVRDKFVNLVLNGNYVGLYWLGEQIKVNSNRVDIDEDNDYLIEMDTYFDETWKFKSQIKKLPVQVKNDDTMNDAKLENLKEKINAIEGILYSPYFPYTDNTKTVYDDSFKNSVDVDSFAKFYLVNEIMGNVDLKLPRSAYFTFENTQGLLKAGPVWDFDWSASEWMNTLIVNDTIYFDALFKTREFNSKIKELLESDLVTEEKIKQEIKDLSEKLEKSALLDRLRWEESFVVNEQMNLFPFEDYKKHVNELESCLTTRIRVVKSQLIK